MKNLRLVVGFILLLVLIYGLEKCRDTAVMDKPAVVSTTLPTTLAAPARSNAQSPPPVIPPAQKTADPAATVTANDINGDPQTGLSTAIPDLANLIQTGDLLTAFTRYMPPSYFEQMPQPVKDQLAQQELNLLADPRAQQSRIELVQILQGMQSQTPTMNEAGDRATYPVEPFKGHPDLHEITFMRVDGKWYISPGASALF